MIRKRVTIAFVIHYPHQGAERGRDRELEPPRGHGGQTEGGTAAAEAVTNVVVVSRQEERQCH